MKKEIEAQIIELNASIKAISDEYDEIYKKYSILSDKLDVLRARNKKLCDEKAELYRKTEEYKIAETLVNKGIRMGLKGGREYGYDPERETESERNFFVENVEKLISYKKSNEDETV